ncbi:helicase-related protein [Pyrobaculum ferrireducens]|uniref:Helicase-like protein n=1 Tax=Pyrobaculum ferrireducens TaxID=1104324 RepID=G7VFV2_9CREN|nr:helicase-related protein [Pyrobaculum ferrireducens]AET31759.1 helicase-like protein [Pyrobaculum ferrireducens]
MASSGGYSPYPYNLLSLLALRIHLLSNYTPCVNPSHSRVDALRYQLDFVNFGLRRYYEEGAVRLLLADDVGLGKTVMAGLLIKELMMRGHVKKVLLVVPKMLVFQWMRELAEKFDIECQVCRERCDTNCGIVSIDFLKRRVDDFLQQGWDFVVFDEAHNLTARGREPTKRYQAAERLASATKNVLLLSATPHHGDRLDFMARIRLIDRSVTDDDSLRLAVKRYVVRRLREDVHDETGIPERHSTTLKIAPSPDEAQFYGEVEKYVRYYYGIAQKYKGKRRAAIGLVATVFLKRASSSTYAAMRTIERRLKALEAIKRGLLKPTETPKSELEAIQRVVDETQLDKEIEMLRRLHQLGQALATDTKYNTLKKVLGEVLGKVSEKIIVFTQYRDTMHYLAERLRKDGYHVVLLHGGMSDEERKAAEAEFRDKGQILVATDAASEGLNLQVANLLINYDLPWNPTRIDQRIGRVHRYGQRRPVLVYNFLLDGTIDGRVYELLLKKLEEIRKALGRVFEYLGNLADERDFAKLIDAALKGRDPSEEVERLAQSKATLKDLEDLLVKDRVRLQKDPRCIDYVTDEELQTLVLGTLNTLDPRSYDEAGGCFRIKYLPKELASLCRGACTGLVGFGLSSNCPERITVEHPLAKAVIQYHLEKLPSSILAEVDKPCYADGNLWVIKGTAEVAIPEGHRLEKYTLSHVAAYYQPNTTQCQKGQVPLSAITLPIYIQESKQSPQPPEEALGEVKAKLQEQVKKLCQNKENAILAEYTSMLKAIDKKKGLTEAQKASQKEELLQKLEATVNMLREACGNAKIETATLFTAIYKPLGYLTLGVEWGSDLMEQGAKGEEIAMELDRKEGCHIVDLRHIPMTGVDYIAVCPDGVRLVEVKTVKGPDSKIHIQPVEWAALCASKTNRARRAALLVDLQYTKALKNHMYLYVVDLSNNTVKKYRDPCTHLANHVRKYKVTQEKYVIPYNEFTKLITPTVELPYDN